MHSFLVDMSSIQLEQIDSWGVAPNPTKGSAFGKRQGGIAPLDSHFLGKYFL